MTSTITSFDRSSVRGRPAADARDAVLGARIRARRLLVGLTQEALGNALGVSFQQIQKYEKGTNRVSVNRLADIARALGCEPTEFYGVANGPAEPVSLSPQALRIAAAFDRLGVPERAAITTLVERIPLSAAAPAEAA